MAYICETYMYFYTVGMQICSIKMLPICVIVMLAIPGLSFALLIENKSGQQQCVTTMEKMKKKNCQIFQCENELEGDYVLLVYIAPVPK